jgi:hypothetical protein
MAGGSNLLKWMEKWQLYCSLFKRLWANWIQLVNVDICHEKMQHASPVETGVRVAFKIVMYQLSNLAKQGLQETTETPRSINCRFVINVRNVLYRELPDTFVGLNASYSKIFMICRSSYSRVIRWYRKVGHDIFHVFQNSPVIFQLRRSITSAVKKVI